MEIENIEKDDWFTDPQENTIKMFNVNGAVKSSEFLAALARKLREEAEL